MTVARLAPFAGVLLAAHLAVGCAGSSDASRSLSFDAASDKAVVVLGTSIDRKHVAPDDPWYRVPHSLLSHWQQYSPDTMQLDAGGGRLKTLRMSDGGATLHVVEVDPGDYALIGAMVGRTLTLFVEPTGTIRFHYEGVSDQALAGIGTQGSVVTSRNFVFSVRPGEVAYIGHFDFVHAGAGEHKIVKVDYWQEAAAARAALQEYPGITAEMLTLNLTLPTEQAAR